MLYLTYFPVNICNVGIKLKLVDLKCSSGLFYVSKDEDFIANSR